MEAGQTALLPRSPHPLRQQPPWRDPALIAEGIPDDAFTAIEGDDKKACAALKKLNARQRAGFVNCSPPKTAPRLSDCNKPPSPLKTCRMIPLALLSRSLPPLINFCMTAILKKRPTSPISGALRSSSASEWPMVNWSLRLSHNPPQTILNPPPRKPDCSARCFSNQPGNQNTREGDCPAFWSGEAIGITSGHLRDFAKGAALPDGLMNEARQLTGQYRFFPLASSISRSFQTQWFRRDSRQPALGEHRVEGEGIFAERRPDIANASTGSKRKAFIDALVRQDPQLHSEFVAALREREGIAHVLGNSGLYPLCGRGRINLFAVFAERMHQLRPISGRAGAVLPGGIANRRHNKGVLLFARGIKSVGELVPFRERRFVFPAFTTHSAFCLITLGAADTARFVFTREALNIFPIQIGYSH